MAMGKWCLKCRRPSESAENCSACGGAVFELFPYPEHVTVAVDTQRLPNETDVAYFVRVYGTPEVNVTEFEPTSDLLALVSSQTAVRNRMVPVKRGFGCVTLAMADPSNIFAIDEIRRSTGLDVEVVVASEEAVAAALARWYGS